MARIDIPPLIAGSGDLAVVYRTAAYLWGSWSATYPDGVTPPTMEPGRELGYVGDLRADVTDLGSRCWTRADVQVDAVEHYSNVPEVFDAAEQRTAGEVFFEQDLESPDLGQLTPNVDFVVGDVVPVLVAGKLIDLPVTSITAVSKVGDELGWQVHVGGQLVSDRAELDSVNAALERQILRESRETNGRLDEVRQTAVSARETADAARREVAAARSDATNAVAVAGKAVVDTAVEFAPSLSRVEAPVSGWSQAYPGEGAGELWQRTVTWFGDGRVERSTPVLVTGRDGVPGPKGETGATGATGPRGATGARGPQGPKGDTGKDGVPGKDGVGVHDTTITYAASASGTQAPASGWGTQPPAGVPAGQFVWTKTTLHYTDSTTEDIYTVGKIGETGPQGAKGNTGATGATGPRGPKGDTGNDGRPGKDGTKLTSTAVTYAVSTSGTTAPSSGWQVQPPAAAPGQFVWTRFVWKYSDNTNETGYSVGKIGDTGPRGPQGAKGNTGATGPQGPRGATGARGDQGPHGATGSPGVSITSVTHFWRWAGAKPGAPTGSGNPSGWSTSQPAYQVGQKLWVTIRTLFSNGQVSWSPVAEEASVSAATAIAAESASTKNRVWYAASAPGSTRGERPGDTWFQYSGNTVVGQWRWTGTSWVTQTIGDQVIANLDAAKITGGIIDARHIGAESIDASKIKAGAIDASKIKADSITVKELKAEVFHQVGTDVVPLKPGTSEPAWWDQADDETTRWVLPMDPKLVEKNGYPTAYQFLPTADHGGTPVKMKRFTRTKQAVHYNLVTVDPDKEYDLSFIAYGHMGGRYYIECRDQDGNHAVKSGGVNKIGERDTQTGTIYLAQNVPTDGLFRYYHTRIRFNESVRAIRIGSIYGNHPNGEQGEGVWIGDIRISPHQVDQAQIDALQNRQIADNKAIIKRLDYLSTSIRAVGPDEWCTDRELGYGVIMPRNNRYMVLLRTKKFKESLQSINAVVFYSNKVKHYCMGYYREGIPGNSTPAWGPVKLGGAINVDRNALDFIQRELGTTDLEMAHFFVELGDVKSAIILAGA